MENLKPCSLWLAEGAEPRGQRWGCERACGCARPAQRTREIRAIYDDRVVRVYQAYNAEIADAAVAAQRFVSPWKEGRMTWIKPSFVWMGYRCGWSRKDANQSRVLALDLHRAAFDKLLVDAVLASSQALPGLVMRDPFAGLTVLDLAFLLEADENADDLVCDVLDLLLPASASAGASWRRARCRCRRRKGHARRAHRVCASWSPS